MKKLILLSFLICNTALASEFDEAVRMLGSANIQLPKIEIQDTECIGSDEITCINNPAGYAWWTATAYGRKSTTRFQWIDEIIEHNISQDNNFPQCDSFISQYCSKLPQECKSEWAQAYVIDGIGLAVRSQNEPCIYDIIEYLYEKLGVFYFTTADYNYAVSQPTNYSSFDFLE
jgi:hypothetical protein